MVSKKMKSVLDILPSSGTGLSSKQVHKKIRHKIVTCAINNHLTFLLSIGFVQRYKVGREWFYTRIY